MKEIILYSNHIHSFSRTIAAKYGVKAALVLGYIAFRIGLSKNERDGKFWYYDTLDAIAQHYPYLGRSAVYEAIQRLTKKDGPLIVGNHNKRKGDRTNWYAFRDEETEQQLKKKLLYFKVEDASLYGIPAAVLLTNLAYHLNVKKREQVPGFRFKALSASRLAQILPFSRSTIQRALKLLVDEGVLLYRTTTDTTLPTEYCFAQPENLESHLAGSNSNSVVLDELLENKGECEIKPAQARIQQMVGSNANRLGSKANETGSNPNDVTIFINPFGNNPLKETVKRNNAVFDSRCCFEHSLSSHSPSVIKNNPISSAKELHYN
jgi:predicted transcriptional regulator